jgi:hypothetical protein
MATRPVLLRAQKNQVFRLLQKLGTDPRSFEWVNDAGSLRLQHSGEEFYFSIDGDTSEGFNFQYWPDSEGCEFDDSSGDWDGVYTHFKTWASVVAKELSEPDFWQLVPAYTSGVRFRAPSPAENQPFSYQQTQEISAALTRLRTSVKNEFRLDATQYREVIKRLDYLDGAAKRQGAADWIHTAIGVFVSIAMGLPPTVGATAKLWELIHAAFQVGARFLLTP